MVLECYLPPSAVGHAFADEEKVLEQDKFDFFFGANWAAFRKDLMDAGGFNERLGVSNFKLSPVGEESHIQQSLISIGKRPVYLPGALAHHYVTKDCYTLAWVRNRKLRHAVAEAIVRKKDFEKSRQVFSVPLWVFRAYIESHRRLLGAVLTAKDIATRTKIQMRIAYLSGLIWGLRTP